MLDHVDLSVLDTLREVMEGEFPSLLEVFIKDSEQRVAGLSALMCDPSFSTASAAAMKQLGEMAHSFKGSSSNMGTSELSELCRQLEALARAPSAASDALARQLVQAIEVEFGIVRDLFEGQLQSPRIGR